MVQGNLMDWLLATEEAFNSANIQAEKRVNLVVCKFNGSAASWWRSVVSKRKLGEPPVATWEELRREMKLTFLPFHYKQAISSKLQKLTQGSQTVNQYTAYFYDIIQRTKLHGSEDHKIV